MNLIDPDGRRVEPANAITGNQLIQMIVDIEKTFPNNSILALRQFNRLGTDYYLEAPGVGTLNAIDVKHMLNVAFVTYSGGQKGGSGRAGGHINELIQLLNWSPSVYSPEDVPSNNLGAQFGEGLQMELLLSVQLRAFLEQIGVNMNDPESLEAFKKAIQAYNAANQNQDSVFSDDESSYWHSGENDAAGDNMWNPPPGPSGYRGNNFR